MDTKAVGTLFLCVLVVLGGEAFARAQEPAKPEAVAATVLQAAIDNLGKLDYATRTSASRTIRRTPANQAVPALMRAVRMHEDSYVRYRALVLLTGFNDPGTDEVMRQVMSDVNDRLRTVAYEYFEHHPDRSMVSTLVAALEKEDAEFVRPALVRALAALGDDSRVSAALIRESGRGEDFFRSAVIEALGDYKAQYAIGALTTITKQDGPLVDDAVLALGKIGEPQVEATLDELALAAPPALQPTVAASLCLVGTRCEDREQFLIGILAGNSESQEMVRGSASALTSLAVAGRLSAAHALFDIGVRSRDPIRSPIALGVATIALRNTPVAFDVLATNSGPEAMALLAEGFDMLEEDFEKERFFALARKTYWSAPDQSATRALMQKLIGELDF